MSLGSIYIKDAPELLKMTHFSPLKVDLALMSPWVLRVQWSPGPRGHLHLGIIPLLVLAPGPHYDALFAHTGTISNKIALYSVTRGDSGGNSGQRE